MPHASSVPVKSLAFAGDPVGLDDLGQGEGRHLAAAISSENTNSLTICVHLALVTLITTRTHRCERPSGRIRQATPITHLIICFSRSALGGLRHG